MREEICLFGGIFNRKNEFSVLNVVDFPRRLSTRAPFIRTEEHLGKVLL